MKQAALLVLAMTVTMGVASTGRAETRAFAETYDTRTGAAGDAQLESWADDNSAYGAWNVWRFWWGATASITDSLEVSAYLLGASESTPASAEPSSPPTSGLQVEMLYLMARWRFLGDGVKGFSLMGQLELCIPALPTVEQQQAYPFLAHGLALGERLVASYGRRHVLASANLLLDEAAVLQPGDASYSAHAAMKWAAGVAYAPFDPGLRGPPFTVGVEAFGDVLANAFDYGGLWAVWWPGAFPVAVGPALSFASGRFWATASWGYAPGEGPGGGPSGAGRPAEGVARLIFALEL